MIEAGAAIWAAVVAHSLTLLAFGIDSLIELASAAVLLWRLNVELVQGGEFSEKSERLASRMSAALLGLLAVYVAISAALGFVARDSTRRICCRRVCSWDRHSSDATSIQAQANACQSDK